MDVIFTPKTIPMKRNCYTSFSLATALFFCLSIFTNNNLKAQQTLTTIDGWNAYVHLPWDYAANPTKTYPTIVFFPGIGEVGTNASRVIANGPGAYITQGWNGNVKIGNDSVKFIVISLQPSAAFPNEYLINIRLQTIKNNYRVDPNQFHLTGLSHGGWCSTTFVTGDAYVGPYPYATQIASVVEVQGMKPDDNLPYPNLFDNFAKLGGRLLGFEQTNDFRDIQTRVNRMNATRPGSAIFVATSFGGGAHCCWNQFYGGGGVQPGTFVLDGVGQNLYQWIARNPIINSAPIVNAGNDTTLPAAVTASTLYGNATDPDGAVTTYSWTKVAGPSTFTLANPNANSTSVTNLAAGTYKFELRATDNRGAIGRDTTTIIAGITVPLPVKLVNFNATLNGNKVAVQWKTSLEINSDKFVVERSNNSQLFEAIGTLQAAGYTSNESNYSFQDLFAQQGNNYYRLKMVDRDGRVEYSRTVVVAVQSTHSININQATVSVKNNLLTMNASSSKVQQAAVTVTDAGGRILLNSKLNLQKGSTSFQYNLSNLSRGVYFLKLVTAEEVVTRSMLTD